jgi:hypothetical protein
MKTAIQLIADERERQKTEEGWTEEHDDAHSEGELAAAAACYAMPERLRDYLRSRDGRKVLAPVQWPWSPKWWKPKDGMDDLVRAGALIAAEIERLQRRGAA